MVGQHTRCKVNLGKLGEYMKVNLFEMDLRLYNELNELSRVMALITEIFTSDRPVRGSNRSH